MCMYVCMCVCAYVCICVYVCVCYYGCVCTIYLSTNASIPLVVCPRIILPTQIRCTRTYIHIQSSVGKRRLFIIEVMGSKCGYLALMSALSTGAEIAYMHEDPITLETLQVCRRVRIYIYMCVCVCVCICTFAFVLVYAYVDVDV